MWSHNLFIPERASPEIATGFPKEYVDLIFASMYKFCPTLVPTTYEAAAEYLREEKMKPKGSRDLRRSFVSIWLVHFTEHGLNIGNFAT